MNEYKRLVLEKYHPAIISDVTNPEDILIHLQSKQILQQNEKDAICCSSNATAELIKVLLHKTNGPWFEEFVEALRQDYYWISDKMSQDFLEERDSKLTHYLCRGNVPPLPQHNVSRKQYLEQLRQKIKDLKRNNFLVVHGMSGSGKTCLVVDALQDISLLENSLGGYVYWMSVGDFRNDDFDDLQSQQLQKKLCDMVNPSISNQRDVFHELKIRFSSQPNNNALLILNDVSSPKVIEALNVGCKILVTTQDCDVIKSRRELFAVSDGFLESESIQLLQDFVLDGPGELLPHIRQSALKIHQIWRGHPMVIGLIGGDLSELKEESQKNLKRWREYERSLAKDDGENMFRRRSIVDEQLSSIIEITLDKLKTDSRKLYEMLAVFVEDANIITDVLRILWGLHEYEVQNIMEHFYRRSLVFRQYNAKLGTSIYGIHDILMGFLKKKVPPSELKHMHSDLVSKYHQACNGDFANLPRDNYIYSYLCHHIDSANEWDQFRDQLFSLRYIEAKLKATGPGDLLLDLHKYEVGLVGKSKDNKLKVECIKKFVENYGWDIHQDDVDIIQCALQESGESFLYDQASKIVAESNSINIYFRPVKIPEKKPKELETVALNVKAVNIITCSSLNLSNGRVLVYPDDEKQIVDLDMNYRLKRRSFKVDSDVVMLNMAPLCDKFLSASDSGLVSIWNLSSDGTSHANTPPPSLRQKDYLSHFSEARSTPLLSFNHKRRVTCARFSNCGKLVVSASEDSTLCVWNLEENKKELSRNVHPNPFVISCSFTKDDAMIVYCCGNFKMFFYDMRLKKVTFSYDVDKEHGGLLTILCMPDVSKKIILVQEKAVLLYSWEDQELRHTREGERRTELKNFQKKILHAEVKSTKITCAVYHPEHNLLIGTSQGCCLYYNVLGESLVPVRFGSGEIKAVDMVGDRVVFSQHNSVKMFWLDHENKVSNVHQPISAHLGWNYHETSKTDTSVYATVSKNGSIEVYHDGKIVAKRYNPTVCIVHVSKHGNHVLLGTSDGIIMIFDIVSGTLTPLQANFLSSITYLNSVMLRNTPVYIAVGINDDARSYSMQVMKFEGTFMHCNDINAPVVKTFLCSNQQCLMAVLSDYSILVWNLTTKSEFPKCVQEGRTSARVTDASLSCKEDVLVLSDMESCYHVFSINWPGTRVISDNINNLTAALHHTRIYSPQQRTSLNGNIDDVDGTVMSNYNLHNNQPRLSLNLNPMDEVDATRRSLLPSIPKVSAAHYPLKSSSWCCCVCSKGEIIAIGHGQCGVLVRDYKKKEDLFDFVALQNHRAKVSHVKFSPYDINLGGKTYALILLVVSDCFSLWDMSPFIGDNNRGSALQSKPQSLGCVRAAGGSIVELSVNSTFTKFSAFDENKTYYLWQVWEKK